ncbi:MAG: hypothetical protein PUD87_06515 [Prevotellaceae bacterium]|nr:hypothetical protein [Prevotellaceae bacterium]
MKVIAVLRKSNSLVYIRVMFGRDKDVKVSTSMHIALIYWDSKIPGYKNTKKVPKKVREKFNNTLKEMIAYVEANVDKEVTCPVLTAIIDDFLHPDRNSKENAKTEDTTAGGVYEINAVDKGRKVESRSSRSYVPPSIYG